MLNMLLVPKYQSLWYTLVLIYVSEIQHSCSTELCNNKVSELNNPIPRKPISQLRLKFPGGSGF